MLQTREYHNDPCSGWRSSNSDGYFLPSSASMSHPLLTTAFEPSTVTLHVIHYPPLVSFRSALEWSRRSQRWLSESECSNPQRAVTTVPPCQSVSDCHLPFCHHVNLAFRCGYGLVCDSTRLATHFQLMLKFSQMPWRWSPENPFSAQVSMHLELASHGLCRSSNDPFN